MEVSFIRYVNYKRKEVLALLTLDSSIFFIDDKSDFLLFEGRIHLSIVAELVRFFAKSVSLRELFSFTRSYICKCMNPFLSSILISVRLKFSSI